MKLLDLYSGIGGFSLGLERAGFETIAFCEIEEYPCSILNKHWPDLPIAKDIRKLSYCWETKELIYDGEVIYVGTIDAISAGFPCQPFSLAGLRGGQEDDRYLWPETLRLIKETRARWFIGENVAGIISMELDLLSSKLESKTITRHKDDDYFNNVLTRQETMCLNQICESLEEINYEVQPLVIPACAVGAIHRRDRVWIIANTSSPGLSFGRQTWEQKSKEKSETGLVDEPERPGFSGITSNPNDCEEERQRRNSSEILQEQETDGRNQALFREDVTNSKSERLQGVASGRKFGEEEKTLTRGRSARGDSQADFGSVPLPVEPPVRHRNDGLPDNVARLKALGNAIVPYQPEVIGRAIISIESE